jgi:hypothetical protein
MTWTNTYSHTFLLALDLWAAAVFFNRPRVTISTMACLVHDGKDAPLELQEWQRSFLRWLAPKLSTAHCRGALQSDIDHLQAALFMVTGSRFAIIAPPVVPPPVIDTESSASH